MGLLVVYEPIHLATKTLLNSLRKMEPIGSKIEPSNPLEPFYVV